MTIRKALLPILAGLAAIAIVSCSTTGGTGSSVSPTQSPSTTAPRSSPAAATTKTVVTAPPFLGARQNEIAAMPISAFARDNLAAFRTFTLKNGIPVIVRLNPSNRIFNVRLVLKGGTLLTPKAKSGIEDIMLQTMARGSAQYDYENLTSILDATSSSIGAEAGFDASAYSLNTLDKYFDQVFPVWADTVIEPSFADKDFAQVKTNFSQALEGKNQDPWSRLAQEMNKTFFQDHPYATPFDGTTESIAAFDRNSIKQWYDATFSANRIFVVAVGNFDVDSLRAKLDATIGTIVDKKVAIPSLPDLKPGSATLFKVEYPQSQGLGYIRGDFLAPKPSSPDFMTANIGFKMFSDLLFNVVRTKYSAVYTPDAYIRGFLANYGSITMFKTSDAGKLKPYIDEALSPLLNGYSLATGQSSGGSHVGQAAEANQATKLEPLSEALPIYQAQYVNAIYEQQQSNSSIAAQIQASAIVYGDFRYYLFDIDRINAVKPDEVQRVMKSILLDGKITWGVIGSKDVIDGIDPAPYRGFVIKSN